MEKYEDEIRSMYKALCNIKTRLLEIQVAVTGEPGYNDGIESDFENIDSFLQKAKEHMFDLSMK